MSAIDWDTLKAEAIAAQKEAHAPYSRFHVGAALLTSDGRIFRGTNVENASYPLSVCAERNAIAAAIVAGARAFSAIAIVSRGPVPASPCGGCRQVLAEFPPSFPVLCFVSGGAEALYDVDGLLPGAFRPSQLEET